MTLLKSNNMNDFLNLIEKIYLSIINKENTNIWDIAENNKNYSLDILSANSSFKD